MEKTTFSHLRSPAFATHWNVDSDTGSLESTGSDLDLISFLNNGSGDPPCAAPKCLELEETG